MVKKVFLDRFSRLDTIPTCDGRTDRQTDTFRRQRPRYAERRAGMKKTSEKFRCSNTPSKHQLMRNWTVQVRKAVICSSITCLKSSETPSWRRCSCRSATSSAPRCTSTVPPTRASASVDYSLPPVIRYRDFANLRSGYG